MGLEAEEVLVGLEVGGGAGGLITLLYTPPLKHSQARVMESPTVTESPLGIQQLPPSGQLEVEGGEGNVSTDALCAPSSWV